MYVCNPQIFKIFGIDSGLVFLLHSNCYGLTNRINRTGAASSDLAKVGFVLRREIPTLIRVTYYLPNCCPGFDSWMRRIKVIKYHMGSKANENTKQFNKTIFKIHKEDLGHIRQGFNKS